MANRFDFIREALSGTGTQPISAEPKTSTARNIVGDILNTVRGPQINPIDTVKGAFNIGKNLIQSPIPTITSALDKASDYLTPDPNNLHLKDIALNLPEATLNMGRDIAQAVNREGVGLFQAATGDSFHTFTPKGQFAKTVLGTDQPINLENEARRTFGMAPKTNIEQRTESKLLHGGLTVAGSLIAGLDYYTGGIGGKGAEEALSAIAKTTDTKVIENALRFFGIEDRALVDVLAKVEDPNLVKNEIETFLSKAKGMGDTTFNVGLSPVRGSITQTGDILVDEGMAALKAGDAAGASAKFDLAIKESESNIIKAFDNTGIKIKIKGTGYGIFEGTLEPNFDMTAVVPKGKEDLFHTVLANQADSVLKQKSALTYKDVVTGNKEFGIIDEARGISNEPVARFVLNSPLTLQDIPVIESMIKEAGLVGATLKDKGGAIDIINLTHYNKDYDTFIEQTIKFQEALNRRGILGEVQRGGTETRLIGSSADYGPTTYQRVQSDFLKQNPQFRDPNAKLTSKVLEKIGNRGVISKEDIRNLAKSKDVSPTERAFVEELLAEFKDKKITASEFAKAFNDRALPISVEESTKYADYGVDNTGIQTYGDGSEAKTYIFHTPVKHGKTGHFDNEGLFGHARVVIATEEGKKVGYITEVQSDLFQNDLPNILLSKEQRIKQINEDLKRYTAALDGYDKQVKAGVREATAYEQNYIDKIRGLKKELEVVNSQPDIKASDFSSQMQYYAKNNRYRTRLIEETFAKLKDEGVEEVRLATPSTAARIEGFAGGADDAPYELPDGGRFREDTPDLEVGDEIGYMGEAWTVVDTPIQGRGWGGPAPTAVVAAPADKVNTFKFSEWQAEEIDSRWTDVQYELDQMKEKEGLMPFTTEGAQAILNDPKLSDNFDNHETKLYLQKLADGHTMGQAEDFVRDTMSEHMDFSYLQDIYGEDHVFSHESGRYDSTIYVVEDGVNTESFEHPSSYANGMPDSELPQIDTDKKLAREEFSQTQMAVLDNYYELKTWLDNYAKENHIKVDVTESDNGATFWTVPLADSKVTAFKMGKEFLPDATRAEVEQVMRTMFDENEMKLVFSDYLGEGVQGRYVGGHTNSYGARVMPMIKLLESEGKASLDTGYHEAFHAFFDLYVSKEQQAKMLEGVRKNILAAGHKLKGDYEVGKRAEEWLADDFARYVRNKNSYTGENASLWERMIKKIREFIRRKEGFDKVYEDILNRKRPSGKMPQSLTNKAEVRQKLSPGTTGNQAIGPQPSGETPTSQPGSSPDLSGQADSYTDTIPQNPNITTPPVGRGGVTPPEIDFTQWKDKPALLLNRDTMIRNLDKVAGKDAPMIKEFLTDPVRENEVFRIKFENTTREMTRAKVVQELGISSGSKEDKLVQRFGEGRMTLEELQKESPKKWREIQEASDFFRKQYDGMLEMINERRTFFGYKEIPKRADYFRHFQEMGKWIESFGLMTNTPTSILPTEISGLTGIFKPGKPFTSAELTRKGGDFTESAIKGFDNYIDSVSRQIFHTDSVQRGRTLDKYIRNAAKEGKATLPNFVANVDEWTNFISGKKSKFDSGMEGIFGRRFFEVVNTVKRRIGSNLVGGSVSSALTNFIPLTQSLATTKKPAFIKGMFESLASPLHAEFNVIGGAESSFLTRRFKDERIDPTNYEKFVMGASWFFKHVDMFTAKSIVSGKFFEQKAAGKSAKEAMRIADEYAGKMIGDRSIGEMPNIFNSKSLGFLTQFQLEVNNVISFMARDIPEMSQGSKVKYVNQMAQFMLYSMLFNNFYEKATGRRPSIDPIYALGTMLGVTEEGKGKSLMTRTGKAAEDIGGNLPFGGLITGGGRLPLTDVLPTPSDFVQVARGKKDWHKELTKAFFGLVPPFGGGQLKKTLEGLVDYNRGSSKTAGGKVRYKIDDTGGNLLRAIFFGRYSFPEVNDYYNKQEQEKKTTTSIGL